MIWVYFGICVVLIIGNAWLRLELEDMRNEVKYWRAQAVMWRHTSKGWEYSFRKVVTRDNVSCPDRPKYGELERGQAFSSPSIRSIWLEEDSDSPHDAEDENH